MAGVDAVFHAATLHKPHVATRYIINDAAWRLGKPNVSGSVFRFEGQVTVFQPGKGPCYRCLFPTPPPPEFAPG